MSLIEIDPIKKEVTIDSRGKATVTIRGAARIVGVKHPTLVRQFDAADSSPSKLTEKLINAGFDGGTLSEFSETGIPDTALSVIIQYYAMDAGRNCTAQAKVVLSAFVAIGLRSWLQKQMGWEPVPVTVEPQQKWNIPNTLSEALLLASQLAADNEKMVAQIERDQPKVDFAEKVENCVNSIDIGSYAKSIGWGRNRLFIFMRERGIIMQNSTLPYQKYVDAGYFEVSQEIDIKGRTIPFATITGKGQIFVCSHIQKYQQQARLNDSVQDSEQLKLDLDF